MSVWTSCVYLEARNLLEVVEDNSEGTGGPVGPHLGDTLVGRIRTEETGVDDRMETDRWDGTLDEALETADCDF